MEGRSYTARLETLGNSQISPMQFFYLRNHSIFEGLYQITKVSHNISSNDMTTNFEGIKMRYGGNTYGGIQPITLDDYEKASNFVKEASLEINQDTQTLDVTFDENVEPNTLNQNIGETNLLVDDSQIRTIQDNVSNIIIDNNNIIIPDSVSSYFVNTSRFTVSSNGQEIPNINYTGVGNFTRNQLITNMNEFIQYRIKEFAEFLNLNYPQWKNQIYITSAIRSAVVQGSSSYSQHLRGQAFDFGFIGNRDEKLDKTHKLFNALMQFLRVNSYSWDQILLETRNPGSVWIHWSFSNNNSSGIHQNILRLHNDSVIFADINNSKKPKSVLETARIYSKEESKSISFNQIA
jgi:hypothetical protein